MKNKIVLMTFLMVCFILFITMANATLCRDDTPISYIPCEVITPYINGSCTDYNYSITNITAGGSSLLEEGNMTEVGDGTYRFSFIYGAGNYSIVLCNNDSATMNVYIPAGDVETKWFYLWFALFGVSMSLYIIGKKIVKDLYFVMFAGILLIVFVPVIYIKGYPTFNSPFVINAFALVLLGMGFYFLIDSAIKKIGGDET